MKENELTIAQMKHEVVASFDSYIAQGTKKWTWESAVRDIPYQVGSLTKIVSQLLNERWQEGKSEQELKAQFRNELADLVAEVMFIAAKLDIDMAQAWSEMLEDDRRKVRERTS